MWKYNETSNLPGNSLYHSADELYHYGVLGMRWRHRKAQIRKNRAERKKRRELQYIKNYREREKENKRIDDNFNNKIDSNIKKHGTKKMSKAAIARSVLGAAEVGYGLSQLTSESKTPLGAFGRGVASGLMVTRGAYNIAAGSRASDRIGKYKYDTLRKKYKKIK